jgi:hypothetical protein
MLYRRHGVGPLPRPNMKGCITVGRSRVKRIQSESGIGSYKDTTPGVGKLRSKAMASYGNVKAKLSLCLTKHHAMKAYWGSERISPRILDLGTRLRWVVRFTLRPLYPQVKSLWYPLDRRLNGPQSRSGRCGEEKNSQPLSEIEPCNPDRPARSPALYRLSYHGSSHWIGVFIMYSQETSCQGPA